MTTSDRMSDPKVVAISGPSGCGKTTLLQQLTERFNSPGLCFDDYVEEHTYPQDMAAWLRRGADTSEIKTPRLITELQLQIDASESPFIFVEEPFGRSRESIAQLIDYVVLLDIPLELCLARIIARNIERNGQQASGLIETYLQKYQSYLWDIYRITTAQTRIHADLVISESATMESVVSAVSNWLRGQSGR